MSKASVLCRLTAIVCALALMATAAQAANFTLRPYVQNVTETSIVICWETDEPTAAVVRYGPYTYDHESESAEPATRHEVVLQGLEPETSYTYRVQLLPEGPAIGASFRTAVRRTSPFVFGVYGDTRTDATAHAFAVGGLIAMKPQFVIHTGDLVDQCSPEAWQQFWSVVNPPAGEWALGSRVPLYPAIGNHELVYAGPDAPAAGFALPGPQLAVAQWRRFFNLPLNGPPGAFYEGEPADHDYSFAERTYSFKFGVAKFVVLDINNDEEAEFDINPALEPSGAPSYRPGSAQYQWLETELADGMKGSAFTFVVFHPAPFSAAAHGKPGDMIPGTPVRVLNPLFLKYKVAAVFSGHDHCYERSLYKDPDTGAELNYVVAGGGGAPLYGVDPEAAQNNPWLVTHYGTAGSREHSIVKVSIEPDAAAPGKWWATVTPTKVFVADGATFDEFRVAGFDPVPLPTVGPKTPEHPPIEPVDSIEQLPEELKREVKRFQAAFNSKKGQEKYNEEYDFNKDGKIDVRDLAIFSGRFPDVKKEPQK